MKRGDVERAQTKGVIREMDRLGRIVVPKELRDHLGMKAFDLVEICLTTEGVIIRTPRFEAVPTEKKEKIDLSGAKNVGLIKEIDQLCRIVIPREIRDFLKLEPYEPVELFLVDDCLVLRNPEYKIIAK